MRLLLQQYLDQLNELVRRGPPLQTQQPEGAWSGDDEAEYALVHTRLETQQRLLRRILSEAGDPVETLRVWHERTTSFCDRYPEIEGWTDRQGESWNAAEVLHSIDTLLEQVDFWQEAAEESQAWQDDF